MLSQFVLITTIAWVGSTYTTAAAAAATTVTPEFIADAIQKAEHALILQGDRTSHIENALNGFQDVLAKKKKDLKEHTSDQTELLVKKLEDLIRQANVKQLEQLQKQLEQIMKRGLRRQNEGQNDQKEDESITKEALDDMFDTVVLLNKSEVVLEKWIRELIEQEVENLVGKDENESLNVYDESCVSPNTAAQEVQTALLRFQQDGIGLEDHAQGGAIVHEMTSQTFQPSPRNEERLGYWQNYIPEEVEELLPRGWVDWEVRIPNFIHHFLGSNHGVASTTASPQTLLHPDTRPGSCWPLQGSSGFITFRLPYTVKASAVTIDHTPELLLLQGSEQLGSAPKQIKIYGYPPCVESRDDCGGLGFDIEDEFLLREIQYDAGGPTTQTFQLGQDNDAAVEESGSCSATTSTCIPPHEDSTVAAIRLKIESNWGNPDYTCLYRFRVHGDAIV